MTRRGRNEIIDVQKECGSEDWVLRKSVIERTYNPIIDNALIDLLIDRTSPFTHMVSIVKRFIFPIRTVYFFRLIWNCDSLLKVMETPTFRSVQVCQRLKHIVYLCIKHLLIVVRNSKGWCCLFLFELSSLFARWLFLLFSCSTMARELYLKKIKNKYLFLLYNMPWMRSKV